MAAVNSFLPDGGGDDGEDQNGDVVMEDQAEADNGVLQPLVIPITSSSSAKEKNLFIEIFPEEMPETPSSTLLQVLKDENARPSVWADAALLYIQHKQHARDASAILQAGCERPDQNREERVRLLASAGIAHLTQAQQSGGGPKRGGSDPKDELSSMADNRFTNSSKVDNLYPMTWMGKGMLNLSAGRLEQARFFFDTTLKEYGRVLPALLGLAAVMYLEKNYAGSQGMYAEAMKLYPVKSGAATRVGFGLACYRLGQVDRAKASFARALDIDPENVDAMVGAAVLDMASLDESSSEFNSLMEKAIKMMSMANLLDHSNAMVQNHLANHYFWKWTPLAGTVKVTHGSNLVQGSQPIPLDPGERIRIGTEFETYVPDDADDADEEGETFRMKDAWKGLTTSGLKVWKKDYDRVIALAKGAYNSTSVQDIQAESLFFLARVYHVRDDFENAHKFYERACKLAPDLSPARFGLAQTYIGQEEYEKAAIHLQDILGKSNTATDAIATLGLLEVKSGKKVQDGLTHLKKAIDLDPLNPDLVLLEALALQQHESTYSKSLERYKKAVNLMERQGKKIPFDIYTNIGVLCHETKQYDESLKMYKQALDASDDSPEARKATLDNLGKERAYIRHSDNDMFFDYVDSNIKVEAIEEPAAEEEKEKDEEKDNDGEEKNEDETKKGSTTLFKLIGFDGKTISDSPCLKEDHIRLGESFESQIVEIFDDDGIVSIKIKDPYMLEDENDDEEAAEKKGDGDGDKKKEDEEGKESEDSKMDDGEKKEGEEEGGKPAATKEKKKLTLFLKRENKRLDKPSSLSIAFNLARLHEAVGRTLAAVELHKAIVKRNPAYVNSYLRLACISIDCGALQQCAGWLKIAAKTAPGNPEVLTLIGNLHLSLCDWAPAQQVFDGLLAKKVPNVEAYAMLSLGNIYFANLSLPQRYTKHLNYAADYYKRILTKDNANAYAANGLGTVLAEKAELFKAKEIFNRVREVSGDTIADAHLNLGHIYLAQKRHPEALQMYQSYLKRTEDGTAPITSKSRTDDKVDVLLYIAFAYFDWARQTELFNNAKAAPADSRYKKAMEHLELALSENTSKNILLTYNLCMTKLQAANCVLQKLTRNIRRTAKEVEDALNGLQQSLETVEEILKKKTEGMKVPIGTSMLNDFLNHCRSNIESAKSHLEDERKREEEANELRELQRLTAEAQRKEHLIKEQLKKEEEAKRLEARDRRAREKMRKVADLRANWEHEQAAEKAAAEKKAKKTRTPKAPNADDGFVVHDEEEQEDEQPVPTAAELFAEDDSDDEQAPPPKAKSDSPVDNDDEEGEVKPKPAEDAGVGMEEQELFGESSDEESDEELVPSSGKRANEPTGDDEDDDQPSKKRKVLEDSD